MNNGDRFVKALFLSRSENTARRTTQFTGNFFAFGFRGELCYFLLFSVAFLYGPFGAFLLGGVTLSNIFALLFLDCLAGNNVVFNIVLVVPSLTLRFINCPAFLRTLTFANERSVAKPEI